VKPADLALLRVPGRPAIGGDGSIVLAVATPDLDADLYRSTLLRLTPDTDGGARDFTLGPRDSEPVVSPDGRSVVFLRAPESGSPQLHLMPLDGGEPRKLTDHRLGAGRAAFSSDGSRIAYCAAVPEAGRYGTDETIKPEGEAPRRITRLSYRLDGEGFVGDKPKQVFVLDLSGGSPDTEPSRPVQLTDEPSGATDPAFAGPDELVYSRPTGLDELTDELVVIAVPEVIPVAKDTSVPDDIAVPDDDDQGTLNTGDQRVIEIRGTAALLTVFGDEICYVGVEFTGIDAAGRTTGLWTVPLAGGSPRRLTDPDTVDVDRAAGPPIVLDERVLVGVLDRGATTLVTVPVSGESVALDDLTVVVGGDSRVVRSFDARNGSVAVVVSSGELAGELVTVTLEPDGSGSGERQLSDFGRPLAGVGIRPAMELATSAPDGYPVHGWLVTPPGTGPHPVLLLVHGGPHSAYTPALFDEAQMYAGAGYAVVMGNPRGSAGYGHQHGRSVIGGLGTVDVDDLLALLDAALDRSECDASRVGVMGGSYGGFMTSWLCSHAEGRFTAAISERAVNAWDSFAGSSDIGYYFARAYVGADRDSQWRASPLAYADDIAVPLLIIHSEQDWRCPLEQGQRLFVALKSRGADVEMLVFPGEGHELSRSGRPRHRRQRFDAILDWWSRYLPIESEPEPSGR